MRNLIVRTLTGAVYVLLLVGCTIYSPVSAFFFFAIVAAATLWEFGSLMNTHLGAAMPRPINAMAGVVLAAAVWLSAIASPQTAQMFALYGLLMLYIIISGLYRHTQKPLKDWALCFASQIYIALPFALLPLLSIVYDEMAGSMAYNWIYPLALFIFLWVNDTFAFLCGCSLSRYIPAKLFPRISPKKSWIGSIGGGLFTLLAAVIIWRLDNGQWSMVNGQWSMVNGQWSMVNPQCLCFAGSALPLSSSSSALGATSWRALSNGSLASRTAGTSCPATADCSTASTALCSPSQPLSSTSS